MKISLDRLFQQKFALLRVISDLSCQYVQYILPSKFKDICLSQTQMKTQSNQMIMSKYLKVKLIMIIEVLEMIQTRQVTVKLKSSFPSFRFPLNALRLGSSLKKVTDLRPVLPSVSIVLKF